MLYKIFKFIHIWGLSLTLGGVLIALLLILFYKVHPQNAKAVRIASHFVAGSGMIIAIISGIICSYLTNWIFFKIGYFMYLKIFFVFLAVIFLSIDIRSQGILRKARINEKKNKFLEKQCIKKQISSGFLSFLCLIAIFVLIVFKPL